MHTVPGRNGGTLTVMDKGETINPLGRGVGVPHALRILGKETKNGELIAKRIVEIALGKCGEQFTGADQLRALTYVHEKILALQAAQGATMPVIDWDKLSDDERSRLVAATSLVREIAERQAREGQETKPPVL